MRTKIIIRQIKSPAEFYIQFSNDTEKCAFQNDSNQNMDNNCGSQEMATNDIDLNWIRGIDNEIHPLIKLPKRYLIISFFFFQIK